MDRLFIGPSVLAVEHKYTQNLFPTMTSDCSTWRIIHTTRPWNRTQVSTWSTCGWSWMQRYLHANDNLQVTCGRRWTVARNTFPTISTVMSIWPFQRRHLLHAWFIACKRVLSWTYTVIKTNSAHFDNVKQQSIDWSTVLEMKIWIYSSESNSWIYLYNIIIIIFIANKTLAGKAIQYNTTLQNIYTWTT